MYQQQPQTERAEVQRQNQQHNSDQLEYQESKSVIMPAGYKCFLNKICCFILHINPKVLILIAILNFLFYQILHI